MTPIEELQDAIESAVRADSDLMSLIADIYDRVPDRPWGAVNGYVSFGPMDAQAVDSDCLGIEDISIQLDVWSNRPGRGHCLGVLADLRRVMAGIRTLEYPIRARGDPFSQVRRDPNGLTLHGILRYEFQLETRHG
ncbi:DUF3168 domain-containing protein [Ketogulonicigenium vulgare]|uniref:DUF3168 domain-containing protein n=1 Tax=Ketogulonicigenium vulgare TaxID=92945 RepID=UPI002359F4AD|nr:DUF3168 domain-containing protein [Ketogulonicigenium vulgare]